MMKVRYMTEIRGEACIISHMPIFFATFPEALHLERVLVKSLSCYNHQQVLKFPNS